ncbi:hypothetical protein [Streptomyces sp. CBMA123]|uniref:hypothetical protein n=1 Tax=Streptomyces sp. CBMA123 TaxID=1896313 RepID=UPI001661C181|nr:hypothetical protein [Streptomyces sp. CBMA123]MBD0691700.1 hypothetical protein [Streptomyces sp. CBMA123]
MKDDDLMGVDGEPDEGGEEGRLLQSLVGEVWVGVYRFGGMGVVDFGATVSWPLGDSGEVSTGSRFAVHARCPFRIVQCGEVYLGSDDLVPAGNGDRLAYDIGADALRAFLARESPRVLAVERVPEGDLRITLEHGLRIDVLPTSSKVEESWRCFERLGGQVVFPSVD